MANIVGYTYKGCTYTPLGMKALLIKTNRIGRHRFEPRHLNGTRMPEPTIASVIAHFIKVCGRDMDVPETYSSDDLPKPVYDDGATDMMQAWFLSARHVESMTIHDHELCQGCNIPTEDEVRSSNGGKIPARIHASVYFNPRPNPENAWHYTVDAYALHDPLADPATIDYGNVESKEQAWACVSHILTHRERFDCQEYVHVRAGRR